MRRSSLEEEAEACRKLAKKLAGQPEEPFLLRLATALEEVATIEAQQCSSASSDAPTDRTDDSAGPRWISRRRS